MALNTILLCDPCGYRDTTKNAHKWCTYCEEGFCVDCEKVHMSTKMSRDHKLISIEDYEHLKDLSVNMNCENHFKRLDLYCKKHDEGICADCISSDHSDCHDIIPIEDATKNAKRSTALADLEATLSRTLSSVKSCIKDRELASSCVDEDEQLIKKAIHNTRISLNKRLDELEQNLLLEMTSKHETCKLKLGRVLKCLELSENELEKIEKQIIKMKEFASDLQIFLATRHIYKKIKKSIKLIEEQVRHENNYSFKVELHPLIKSLLGDIQQLGEIKLTEQSANLQLKNEKIEQAQIQIRGLKSDFHSIRFHHQHSFNHKWTDDQITGCIILPDKRIIVAGYVYGMPLLEYDISGTHIRNIPVSSAPFDLTAINTHRIAVTYGGDGFLDIIDIRENIVERTIRSHVSQCWGISYQDAKLYVASKNNGIVVMDMKGSILNKIRLNAYYITTTTDRMCYTNYFSDIVYCCSLTGQEIWKFEEMSTDDKLETKGISLDHNQNVLVVCRNENSLRLINHDGKESKTVITADDGLNTPYAVCYNTDEKILCIGLKMGVVGLYQMS